MKSFILFRSDSHIPYRIGVIVRLDFLVGDNCVVGICIRNNTAVLMIIPGLFILLASVSITAPISLVHIELSDYHGLVNIPRELDEKEDPEDGSGDGIPAGALV